MSTAIFGATSCYMFEIFSFQFSYFDFAVLSLVGLLIGMAKTGIQGANMIAVPMVVIIFGGKNSTGVMLPILMFADIFGVQHYHQHADWNHLKKLLPSALVGVCLGTITGNYINDEVFVICMAMIIFLSLIIMVWREKTKPEIPTSIWFASTVGVTGGFTTMVGNLAGSVMAMYLLAMRLPKNQFIGTAAWFFLVINLFKFPFHVVVWKTITFESFLLDVLLIPAIAVGAYLGIRITKKISEKDYRWFIIIMAAVAAVAMLL